MVTDLPINEVVVDLDDGGRWTSLVLGGREWLWSGPGLISGPRSDLTTYVDAGGLDECFPTVRGLPDHGALWNQPWGSLDEDEDWDAVQHDEAVLLRRFNGGDPPAEMDETGAIWVDYRLIAPPGHRFIWAAHALLDCAIGAKLDIPHGTECRLYLDTPPAPAASVGGPPNSKAASASQPAAPSGERAGATPSAPATSATPAIPSAPATSAPATSAIPAIPSAPATSAPATSAIPATPATSAPATTAIPAIPSAPATSAPATSAIPSAAAAPVATEERASWIAGRWPAPEGADLSTYGPTDGTATGAVLLDCPSASVIDGDHALTFSLSCPGQPVSTAVWRNLGGYPAEAPYRSLGVEPMLGRVFGLDEAGPGDAAVVPESGELSWRLVVSAASVPSKE
jgi:hypothetical protein